jgi:hypothetical protein
MRKKMTEIFNIAKAGTDIEGTEELGFELENFICIMMPFKTKAKILL